MQAGRAIGTWLRIKERQWTPKVAWLVDHYALGWLQIWGPEIEVSRIRVEHVENVKLIRDDGLRSAGALNQEASYMGQFFRWCIRRGYCDGDPTDAWERKPEVVRKKYVFLSQQEIRRLFDAADTQWLRRFIVLATSTGAREGTLRLADWSWVDSQNRLHLPAWALKTKEAKCLPLSEWALEMLGARPDLASRVPEAEPMAGAAPPPAAPRPASQAGRGALGEAGAAPLIPGMPGTVQVWRAVKRAGRRAGLDPALGPHDLRRTFSGRLLELGVSPERVQQLGGWRSRGVFLGHYFPPVAPDEAQKWVNGI